jgi:protein AaeX
MMVEEIHIAGVYIPAALAWALIALLITFLIRGPLMRLPLSKVLWQPALIELALFLLLWWGIAGVADTLHAHDMVF